MPAREREEDINELRAAAEQGNGQAAMRLCRYSIHELGDEAGGLTWYRRARAAGQTHSADALGIEAPIYKDDVWGTREISPLEKLPREQRLAKAGDPAAQYRLGTLFACGAGVSLDYVQAYAWFVVAARPGLEPQVTSPLKHDPIPDWGTPSRAARVLKQVMEEEELELARSLADDYLKRFGGEVSAAVKFYYLAERCKSKFYAITVMLPALLFLTVWDRIFPPISGDHPIEKHNP